MSHATPAPDSPQTEPTLDRTTLRDPLALAQALVRAPSVTPADAGALDILSTALRSLGFVCSRHPFEDVDNLYARLGAVAPNFCFAGHTDVVPSGPDAEWSAPPFAGHILDGKLFGRGAADMKGAIAAFVAAVARRLDSSGLPNGSISLLITGDEEGPAINGTRKLLAAVSDAGERIDHCLVGEPTSLRTVGDVVKVGRRGSLNGRIWVRGRQGHVAYPERAENPIAPLLELIARLMARQLDEGAPHFQPSNLEVTSVDVGNPAHNVIPGEATARFNIRFNTNHSGAQLERWIEAERAAVAIGFAGTIEVSTAVTGEAFLTDNAAFLALLAEAVRAETGRAPALTTGGGTSDARFIKDVAPVAELGLVGSTMHKIDEHVPVADIEALTRIYERVLSLYFDAQPGAGA